MCKRCDKPTPEQSAALQSYASRHGKQWKESLRSDWMTGRDTANHPEGALLRQIRNTFGPSWLNSYQLPKE